MGHVFPRGYTRRAIVVFFVGFAPIVVAAGIIILLGLSVPNFGLNKGGDALVIPAILLIGVGGSLALRALTEGRRSQGGDP